MPDDDFPTLEDLLAARVAYATKIYDTIHVFGDECLYGKRHLGYCRYLPAPKSDDLIAKQLYERKVNNERHKGRGLIGW